ncbi:hypothetical protein KFU94_55290 [Chloroflexi bacterium TSY]|nr:hypothetical protein [Chloroflexi bacterium TSY]
MQPIVNGFEEEYGDRLAFDRLDANAEPGKTLLREYSLRGHPSYVIVDQQWEKLWSASGVLEEDILREAISEHLQ